MCALVRAGCCWLGWMAPGTGECHSVVTYAQDVLCLAETFLCSGCAVSPMLRMCEGPKQETVFSVLGQLGLTPFARLCARLWRVHYGTRFRHSYKKDHLPPSLRKALGML